MNNDRGLAVIMLCLFIVWFASSPMDSKKYRQVGVLTTKHAVNPEEFHTLFQAGVTQMGHLAEQPVAVFDGYGEPAEKFFLDTQAEFYDVADELQEWIDTQALGDVISIQLFRDIVMLRFHDELFFEKNKAQIKTEAYALLNELADVLLKYSPVQLDIKVHTDNEVVNTVQYPNSWYLTSAKAVSLGLYFQETKGMPHQMVTAYGEGKYTPLVANDTEENKSKNRRVEIYITYK